MPGSASGPSRATEPVSLGSVFRAPPQARSACADGDACPPCLGKGGLRDEAGGRSETGGHPLARRAARSSHCATEPIISRLGSCGWFRSYARTTPGTPDSPPPTPPFPACSASAQCPSSTRGSQPPAPPSPAVTSPPACDALPPEHRIVAGQNRQVVELRPVALDGSSRTGKVENRWRSWAWGG